MYEHLRSFLRICLLDAYPQDLPASNVLLAGSLVGYALVSMVMALPLYGMTPSLLQAALEVVLLMGYTRLALQLSERPERLMQTASALAGAGVIIGVVALPVTYSLVDAGREPNPLTLTTYLLVLVWLVTVYGHVFRQALSTGWMTGVSVAFGYIVVTSVIIESLFPPPALP